MQRQQQDNLIWLEFELLADLPHVKHAVYLRHGGVSEGAFASLNTGFHLGDRAEHVQKNIQTIQTHLQCQVPVWKHLVWGKGIHGINIAQVNSQSTHEVLNVDGLMTSEKGVSLMIKHADCQVALFYDPIHHAAACIHAGWRGSVANIYLEAVKEMQQAYGSAAEELLVCISPSLGPDEAEFIHYRSELPEEFWGFQVRPTYFDFWSISESQLQAAGVLPHHIEVARLSTYANSLDYFSYRRDKVTGRHATCITLL